MTTLKTIDAHTVASGSSYPRTAIGVLFFVHGTLYATWVSRIPGVKEAAGLSDPRLGLVLLAMGAGTFLALPLTSRLIGRWGSGPVTIAGALACCATLPLAGVAASLPSLAAALALFGAVLGCVDVAMNAQAALVERTAGRSLMASFHGLWSLGGLVGAGLGGILARQGLSPSIHFLGASVLLALAVAGVSRGWVSDGSVSAVSAPLAWPSRGVLTIGLLGSFGSVTEGGIADWSGVYLREALGADAGFAAGGYAAFSLAMVAGRLGGDRLIDRFGAVALLRAAGAVAALALATALLWRNPVGAVAAFAVAGLGMSTVFPIVFGAAGRVHGAPPGHAIAAVATMAYGGGLVGPPLIGFAAGVTSLPVALWSLVLAAMAIVALAERAASLKRV